MVARRKRPSSFKQTFAEPTPQQDTPYQKWFTVKTVILVVVTIIATFAVTRFFEKLHYDNLLTQASATQANLQAQSNAYQHDARFLIKNAPTTVNCYQLQSLADRTLCTQHNYQLNH